MRSPFLAIDPSEWVASNKLAVAIRDRYPVTDGHTLVVPRRLVATWFDASRKEQQSIFDLVEQVKRQLDAEFSPDGYNVGFNAGDAAGQTVMHLHVHVIPRYRGDMDDPRGGVRHVIPSRGNYLAQAAPLAAGGERDPFVAHLQPLLRRATEIAIVAAFVQQSGLDRLRTAIADARSRGARIRLLTGDYLNITQAAALEELLDWMLAGDAEPDFEDAEEAGQGRLEARVIEVDRLAGRTRSFHPKSYRVDCCELGPPTWAWRSSAAATYLARPSRPASSGTCASIATETPPPTRASPRPPLLLRRAVERSDDPRRQGVAAYAQRARRRDLPLPAGEDDAEELPAPPAPHGVQAEALTALQQTRAAGYRRGLVVLATGLGKLARRLRPRRPRRRDRPPAARALCRPSPRDPRAGRAHLPGARPHPLPRPSRRLVHRSRRRPRGRPGLRGRQRLGFGRFQIIGSTRLLRLGKISANASGGISMALNQIGRVASFQPSEASLPVTGTSARMKDCQNHERVFMRHVVDFNTEPFE